MSQERQTLLKRFTHNIDLPLLLLFPIIAFIGLVYTEPPLSGALLYCGLIGFAVALVMNHRKHRAKRQP